MKPHYIRTESGILALEQRSATLNARQRRILLLIGSDDFTQMPEALQSRIAPEDLIQELLQRGLIADINTDLATTSATNPIKTPNPNSTIQIVHDASHIQNVAIPPSETALDFSAMQSLMLENLQRYCGLMAKQLILDLKKAESYDHLKQCQMRWITFLQESHIPKAALAQQLKLINYSFSLLLNKTE